MSKLIDVTEAKQLAYALFPDPILRMAINRLLEETPAAGAAPAQATTVADRIRSLSNRQLADAIMDLYLRLQDPEFDLSEFWCHPEYHGLCTGSQTDRVLFCNAEEREKCILCTLNLPAEEW